MADLSPQAQAVLDAYANSILSDPHGYKIESVIAAALQAAADQVAPLSTNRRQNAIRSQLLAIAAELEGSDA